MGHSGCRRGCPSSSYQSSSVSGNSGVYSSSLSGSGVNQGTYQPASGVYQPGTYQPTNSGNYQAGSGSSASGAYQMGSSGYKATTTNEVHLTIDAALLEAKGTLDFESEMMTD